MLIHHQGIMVYTASMFEAVAETDSYSERFNIPEFSASDLLIGDPIKCYDFVDNAPVYAGADYWPVLYDSNIICSVMSVDNGNGTVSFILSSGIGSELDAAFETQQACAVVCDSSTFIEEVITQEEEISLLSEASSVTTEAISSNIECHIQDGFVPLDGDAIPVTPTAVAEPGYDEPSTFAVPRPVGVIVSVPLKLQADPTCWATAVSSIGEHMTGQNINFMTICRALGIPTSGTGAGGLS